MDASRFPVPLLERPTSVRPAKHNLNTPESYALLRRDPGERGPYNNWSHNAGSGNCPELHTVHMLLGTHTGPGWSHSFHNRPCDGRHAATDGGLRAAVSSIPAVPAAISSTATPAASGTATPAAPGTEILHQLRRTRRSQPEVLPALRFAGELRPGMR